MASLASYASASYLQNGAPDTPHFTWQVRVYGGVPSNSMYGYSLFHCFLNHSLPTLCPLQQMYMTDLVR